jgi:glycosyltransferase involved in cell wall biosynthesis
LPGFTVVIPAYNEGQRISATICALKSAGRVDEVLVVDDGSVDDTAGIAKRNGARVLRLPSNVGKGGALNAACPYIKSDFVLIIDADLQESARQALLLVEPVTSGQADLAIAGFPPGKGGQGFGLARRTAAWGIKMLTGQNIKSPLSGQRCLAKKVLLELLPLAPRFGLEVGMLVDALRKGYSVLEVETGLEHCPPGRDWQGFLHRGRQFVDICLALGSRCGRLFE